MSGSPDHLPIGKETGVRPIRVLHIANHIDIALGGSIWATFQIAANAHGGDIQCEVAGTIHRGSNSADYFRTRFPHIKIHTFPCHFPKHNHASIGLFRWLLGNAGNYDLIHAHQIFHWPFIYASWIARWRKRALIVSPHNSLDPSDLRKHSRAKHLVYGPLIVRPALSGAVLLCTAPKEAERAVVFGATPPPRRMAVPLPVDDPMTQASSPGEFRSRHKIDPTAFVVLFLSRLDHKKGLDLLIAAFPRLLAVRPDAVLAIVGEGDPTVRAECEALADRLGIAASLRWCGFATGSAKAAAFRESSIFVLPSHYENFALAVIEAMWAGLPVLTTTGVFIADTLAEHRACLICEPATDSIAEGLERLSSDTALCESFRTNGRVLAESHYSAAAVRPQYQAFYRSLLKAGRRDLPTE
jgi:glycosyltransferase involved in cell wall biosynthesis